eukprot:XP_020404679.1 uncharacterized protein LOC109944356 [Zea mays]
MERLAEATARVGILSEGLAVVIGSAWSAQATASQQSSRAKGFKTALNESVKNCKALAQAAEKKEADRTAMASSSAAPKATPPSPGTRPTDGSDSQQQESAGSGAGGPPLAAANTALAASHALARGSAAVAPASGGVTVTEGVPAGGSVPTSDIAPTSVTRTLEAQRAQQVKAVERMQKWQQELEGKASDAALAEENLKAKGQSLDRRETDLARRETDLAFREEMLTWRGELLAEHELEAEKKEKELEEQIRQFNTVLDSTADRLRRLDQILGARLEVEGSKLCQAVVEYVLTCFRSHDPAISLAPVIAGPVAAIEDVVRESVQDAVELVAEHF